MTFNGARLREPFIADRTLIRAFTRMYLLVSNQMTIAAELLITKRTAKNLAEGLIDSMLFRTILVQMLQIKNAIRGFYFDRRLAHVPPEVAGPRKSSFANRTFGGHILPAVASMQSVETVVRELLTTRGALTNTEA